MTYFLKSSFLALLLVLTNFSVAQEKGDRLVKKMPFQPMFSFGTSYYSFQGDIMGPSTNSLVANMGYKAGFRFNVAKRLDMSFLFSNNSFYESNEIKSFESNVDAVGLHVGYSLDSVLIQGRMSPYISAGLQRLSFKTYNGEWFDRESALGFPFGLGVRLNISERIDLDALVNYTLSMADIDKSSEALNDNFTSITFLIHYDLFTPRPKKEKIQYIDNSYYKDVDFNALDLSDEDSDGVPDINDLCAKTPSGASVNESGCPTDEDKDGVPDYLDKQPDTQLGALVDEFGRQLTEKRFKSIYSEYKPSASRNYAEFYNEKEIKREDFKTIDEYLIAKANAFNKAYNDGKKYENIVEGIKYKIQIGKHNTQISKEIQNSYLSLDDLQSYVQNDGNIIYVVGDYQLLDNALGRKYELESNGFEDTYIIEYNNGVISKYQPSEIDTTNFIDDIVAADTNYIEEQSKDLVLEGFYRVQIIAHKQPLNDAVFEGIENVLSFPGDDGWIRYMTGTFVEYADAINHMREMRVRGFDDAFIVTFRNGKRINLNIALSSNDIRKSPLVEIEEESVDIDFNIQLLIAASNRDVENSQKMKKLGSVSKEQLGTGTIIKYTLGPYKNLTDAENKLKVVREAGFLDAFIFSVMEGERIPLYKAKSIIK